MSSCSSWACNIGALCDLQQLLLQACVLTRAYVLPVSCFALAVKLVAVVIMCFWVLLADTGIVTAWFFRLSTSLVLQ